MIKNWKITAYLCSPLVGEPPMLDAIMEWELAKRMGMEHHRKLTRNVHLSSLKRPLIPVARKDVPGGQVYQCSSPIMPGDVPEWVEHLNKRLDTNKAALRLSDKQRKSLLTASGPYKMRHVPMRIRLVDRIVWFVRGDRKEINKILKSIPALGKLRHYGYGLVSRWEYEEVEANNALFANNKGKLVLMRPLPLNAAVECGAGGYKQSFGSCDPPYWHPDRYMDIAVPV